MSSLIFEQLLAVVASPAILTPLASPQERFTSRTTGFRSPEDHHTALSASSALTTPPVLVADRPWLQLRPFWALGKHPQAIPSLFALD